MSHLKIFCIQNAYVTFFFFLWLFLRGLKFNEYLLTGKEKCLSIRSFDRRDKLSAYERQGHKCAICNQEFDFEEMQGDHIIPWAKGGKTVPENCQMLCTDCNLKKSDK